MIGEVERELEHRDEVNEPLAYLVDGFAQRAAQLMDGDAAEGLRTRGDDVGHGLRLAQVHLALEEGALRVLARAGHAAAVGEQQAYDSVRDKPGAVACYLDAVLARVGMGRAIWQGHYLVYHLLAVSYLAEGGHVGLALREAAARGRVEYLRCDVYRFPARDAYDIERSSRSSGRRADGVAEIDGAAHIRSRTVEMRRSMAS